MATSPRKMAAKAIKKMHMPAYWPVVSGVQAIEYSGVVDEVKKVMAILDIPIIESAGIGMAGSVELPIDILAIVLVGGIEPSSLIVDIAMFRCTRYPGIVRNQK